MVYYGIFVFTYIWLFLMVHVGGYTIHGSYGNKTTINKGSALFFAWLLFLAFLQSIRSSTMDLMKSGIVHTKQNAWKRWDIPEVPTTGSWKLVISQIRFISVHHQGMENFKFIFVVTHQGVLTGGHYITNPNTCTVFWENPLKKNTHIFAMLVWSLQNR